MHTKLNVEITGSTAQWINDAANAAGWTVNGLISYVINQADTLNSRGLLVVDGAEVPSIAGYDVQTDWTQTFEVGELVNVDGPNEETLVGMVLSTDDHLGIEIQLTPESARIVAPGASRDIWSVDSVTPIAQRD